MPQPHGSCNTSQSKQQPLKKEKKKKVKKGKTILFIHYATGVDKEAPGLCWLEVLLAGEHQSQFGNHAFIINSSIARGAVAGMLWRMKTEIDLSPRDHYSVSIRAGGKVTEQQPQRMGSLLSGEQEHGCSMATGPANKPQGCRVGKKLGFHQPGQLRLCPRPNSDTRKHIFKTVFLGSR